MTKIYLLDEKKPSDETPPALVTLLPAPADRQRDSGQVRHYFLLSLFSILCCCPATGLIALAYSIKSSAKSDVNFHDKARLYSRRALRWNIVSIVLGVLSVLVVFLYIYQVERLMKPFNCFNSRRQEADAVQSLIQSITDDMRGP